MYKITWVINSRHEKEKHTVSHNATVWAFSYVEVIRPSRQVSEIKWHIKLQTKKKLRRVSLNLEQDLRSISARRHSTRHSKPNYSFHLLIHPSLQKMTIFKKEHKLPRGKKIGETHGLCQMVQIDIGEAQKICTTKAPDRRHRHLWLQFNSPHFTSSPHLTSLHCTSRHFNRPTSALLCSALCSPKIFQCFSTNLIHRLTSTMRKI